MVKYKPDIAEQSPTEQRIVGNYRVHQFYPNFQSAPHLRLHRNDDIERAGVCILGTYDSTNHLYQHPCCQEKDGPSDLISQLRLFKMRQRQSWSTDSTSARIPSLWSRRWETS